MNSVNERNLRARGVSISSKSDYTSESEDLYLSPNQIIVKEKIKSVIISKQIFDKLLNYMKKNVEIANKYKNKLRIKVKRNYDEFQGDRFIYEGIKKEIKDDEAINKIILENNKEIEKKYEEEIKKLKGENAKLKLAIKEFAKTNKTQIDNYKAVIEELNNQINSMGIKTKNLETKKSNIKYEEKNNLEKIFKDPKINNIILSYINEIDQKELAKINKNIYSYLYFKIKCDFLSKKLIEKNKMIENYSQEDLMTKFNTKENEISDLFNNYIINQKISGKEMRNEIINSLIFIEKNVKAPLNKNIQIEENNNIKNEEPKKFIGKFISALKNEIKGDINLVLDKNIKYNTITFSPNEFKDLFEADKHVLNTFNTDKTLNVNFEFKNSDDIKLLLNEFFQSKLAQDFYQKFIIGICETYSDLLYSSFQALNDIKNLEIIVYVLYCRYMKFKGQNDDLRSVINDLNQYADTSKQVKEMLIKKSNDLDIKYNNSLMVITQLNNENNNKKNQIANISSELKIKEEKHEKFKTEIIKEYKIIKNDFDSTKKERDLLKYNMLQLKEYFIHSITDKGDILK